MSWNKDIRSNTVNDVFPLYFCRHVSLDLRIGAFYQSHLNKEVVEHLCIGVGFSFLLLALRAPYSIGS